ncbi:hypothetical protein [Maribacter sp.]|uniref:hypothetical protein n=1 Tax=Maribacter sp. TaxID=1897614 RepID=UPI0025BB1767|nr:hypothetical protein [Maribacter sp.]
MSKSFTIIGVTLCLSNVFYSFMGDLEQHQVFGLEMGVWVYRLIWVSFAAGIVYEYYQRTKTENK